MAFSAPRQGKKGTVTATSLTITLDTVTVAGNLLIVNFAVGDISAVVSSVADDKSNTFAKAIGPISSVYYQYYAVQVTGGVSQVTITLDRSTGITATVEEFSGGMNTNATVFDKATSNTGSGISSSVSFTPTNNGELIVAAVHFAGATSAWVAGTNYVMGQTFTSQSTEYRLSSNGTETAPMTWTTSQGWVELAGAYIAAPLGGGFLLNLI